MSTISRLGRRLVFALAALALAACGNTSGVLVSMSWQAQMPADQILVETRVGGATAFTPQTIKGPVASPYRLMVDSPAKEAVELRLSAMTGTKEFATARLSVTPGDNEVLEIAIELQPVP
jgi:hypothetical protein